MKHRRKQRDNLPKLLELQGKSMVEKRVGWEGDIYTLLRSVLYTPSTPTRPPRSPEGFFECEIESVFLGMDPGNDGALALVTDKGASAVVDYQNAKTWREVLHVLGCLHSAGLIFVTAYLERLKITTGFHAKAHEVMMRTSGIWSGALTMSNIPFAEVLPHDWQKHHDLSPKDLEQRHQVVWKSIHGNDRAKLRKQSHRERALEKLPHMNKYLYRVKDHNRADALLMALMARDNLDFF